MTSYTVVSSEHSTYLEATAPQDKSKPKKKGNSKGSDSENDSDDSAEHFGRTVVKRGARKTASKKKLMHALFGVRWWRIVLGQLISLSL